MLFAKKSSESKAKTDSSQPKEAQAATRHESGRNKRQLRYQYTEAELQEDLNSLPGPIVRIKGH